MGAYMSCPNYLPAIVNGAFPWCNAHWKVCTSNLVLTATFSGGTLTQTYN